MVQVCVFRFSTGAEDSYPSKYPSSRASGPKLHTLDGTWTLWVTAEGFKPDVGAWAVGLWRSDYWRKISSAVTHPKRPPFQTL